MKSIARNLTTDWTNAVGAINLSEVRSGSRTTAAGFALTLTVNEEVADIFELTVTGVGENLQSIPAGGF
jgi:hypothetical protein